MPAIHAPALALVLLCGAFPDLAAAEVVEANCTGMLDFDIYRIDTAAPEQDVAGIGPSQVSIDDGRILLSGAYGTYRFDLKLGTLYLDDRDTGRYCTYARRPS